MGSSSTAAAGHDYEVFLSFRGPDTRDSFTDHLYHSLKDAGVHVFRDNEELRKGEVISDNLIQAINKSAISIPVFSQGYASSKWCLIELAHIAKSSNHVMPIFYHISPSDVRNQTGTFRVSFDEHERSFKEETVVEWKRALKQVGQLKGWHIENGSSEAEVIEEVLNTVLHQLKKSYVALLPNFLVGVEDHVEIIKSKISAGSLEEKIIGIHGPGGIGKSTLATIVYNQLSNDFKGQCSFLANVRVSSNHDTDIMRLQNQLLSNILKSDACKVNSVHDGIATIKERLSTKKVLICFDDVSKRKQLKALMGDSSWFGPGSKIIITTRNKELLHEVGAYSSYEVPEMDSGRSLQLFSNLAFKRDSPPPDYMTYSERVVKLTGGLPLALEVIGSLLHGKAEHSWKSKLEKLEKVPHKDVQESLMISYKELDDFQKQMFLDVACFFVGFDKTTVLYFWDSDLCPKEGMEVLEHMSLLKIKEDNIIWMHDQLIEFGRSITYQNGNVNIGNRSRLCVDDEAYSILKKGRTEESVEAIMFSSYSFDECRLKRKTFTSVPNLKFLQVECHYPYEENWFSSGRQCMNLTVLPQLRWLSLHHLNPQGLSIDISRCNLVILDLSRTGVTQKWDGWSQIKAATNLKVLNLSYCNKLKMTPDLSAHGKLECLILHGCTNLSQIHKSIGRLKRLVFLDLSLCKSLQQLPKEVGQQESLRLVANIDLLKTVSLKNCQQLLSLPRLPSNLVDIYISDCRAVEGPIDASNWNQLKRFQIVGGSSISTIRGLPSSLVELHLSYCRSLMSIGDISNLRMLSALTVKDCAIMEIQDLPSSLVELHLSYCRSLKSIGDISNLRMLSALTVKDCAITEIRGLPSSLVELHLSDCVSLKSMGDISNLKMLPALTVKKCAITEFRGLPSGLVELHLSYCIYLKSIGDISNLRMLSALTVKDCAITEIRGLPSSLVELHLYDCVSLKSIGDISNLRMLSALTVKDCAITEFRGLPSGLVELHLYGCRSLKSIGDISNLKRLSAIVVIACAITEFHGFPSSLVELHLCGFAITEIPGLDSLKNLKKCELISCGQLLGLSSLPVSLEELHMSGTRIKMLDISDLAELKDLGISCCPIEEIRGLDGLENLKKLIIRCCRQLLGLPRLPHKLVKLDISYCPIKMLEFSDSAELKDLSVWGCPLEETRGLESLVNLSTFNGAFCSGKPELELLLGKLVAPHNRPSHWVRMRMSKWGWEWRGGDM